MIEEVSLDPHRMFRHGCAFADCAKYCETEPNNIKYRTQSHTVSGIVNSAFACEVFIKTLLVFHGTSFEELNRFHKLETLWSKLKTKDCRTTSLVEQRVQEWFNSKTENLFDKLLSEISDAFVYWRYIYEKDSGSLNLNFLRYFRELLREVCCSQLYGKTWNEYINIVDDINNG